MPTLETLPQNTINLTSDVRPETEEVIVVETPVVEEVVEEPKKK
jgi:hypothetical protein